MYNNVTWRRHCWCLFCATTLSALAAAVGRQGGECCWHPPPCCCWQTALAATAEQQHVGFLSPPPTGSAGASSIPYSRKSQNYFQNLRRSSGTAVLHSSPSTGPHPSPSPPPPSSAETSHSSAASVVATPPPTPAHHPPPLLTPAAQKILQSLCAVRRYQNFSFQRIQSATNSRARTGLLKTPHGDIETPAFIFCATKGTVKAVTFDILKQLGTQAVLSNTYHLMVYPGGDHVKEMGGLRNFAGSHVGPLFTDSGGYQIFSLGHGGVADEIKKRMKPAVGDLDAKEDLNERTASLLQITENGAKFRSYFDGSIKQLTPENSMQIQRQLGSDFAFVLDECTAFHVPRQYTAGAMHRSHRWAVRCIKEFDRTDDGSQAVYGIVQGGVYPDLRAESASFANAVPFFGLAIGGSLGDSKHTMHSVVAQTASLMRTDRPVHLLGIGDVVDIIHGVKQGIDTFDCVHPTRIARHGGLLVKRKFWDDRPGETSRQYISIKKAEFAKDQRSLDDQCGCHTCKTFSRSYLHFLMKSGESLGGALLTVHNVYFMNKLMEHIRHAITDDSLDEVAREWVHPQGLHL
eukprot:GHVS01013550.1.p1 GENE.GHVS01013550.1~~GHVS01013550.1.p1  ORF type:complete len:575 (+),score=81.47 GHVS01013550.1:95-1819(+)